MSRSGWPGRRVSDFSGACGWALLLRVADPYLRTCARTTADGCSLPRFLRAELPSGETGDWKVAGTRRLESLRYVAPTFLSAGAGDFPVPS